MAFVIGKPLGTQFVAALIVVYGVFMAPIGWALALVVWAYAMLWFLVTDALKVLFYRHVMEKSSKVAPTRAPYVPAANPKS